jgi:hypothetical protein
MKRIRIDAEPYSEHPCLNTELNGTGNDGRDDLAGEHGPGRNLHVMTELEIRGERKSLGHGNVTPGLEHHHGDGTSGKCVSDDEFGNDVETDLLVGDS